MFIDIITDYSELCLQYILRNIDIKINVISIIFKKRNVCMKYTVYYFIIPKYLSLSLSLSTYIYIYI